MSNSKIGRTIYFSLLTTGLLLILAVSVCSQNDDKQAELTSATYIGNNACKACHAKVYDSWSPSPHGKTLTVESLSAELKGCEACHGPGSTHVSSGAQIKPPIPKADDAATTNALCGKCHFSNRSSSAPKEWQNLSTVNYARSTHGRKGLSCLSCHEGHPNGNDGALLKPAKDLCLNCHASVLEDSPGKKAAYTHSPVASASGQCLTCHDPHGSSDRRMVRDNLQQTCEQCHNPTEPNMLRSHMNYTVAGAKCISCHDPHSHNQKRKLIRSAEHMPFKQRKCEICHTKPEAGEPATLNKPAKELCFSCHPSSGLMPENENAHLPAKEGLCISCHDPHASNQKRLLKTRQAYACFMCHSKVEGDTVAEHRHKILDNNLDCAMCHKPHSSSQKKLLVKDQMALCGQCHKHSYSHPMGASTDGSSVVDPNTGNTLVCTGCHEAHGSTFAVLTRGEKNRELCVLCHKLEQ